MSLTNEEAKEKLDDLATGDYRFNSWEADFVSDVIGLDRFTENQLNKIEELWGKYCG